MLSRVTNDKDGDAVTLALLALGWTLQDTGRADRLLALTGLDATDLRSRASDPVVLGEVLAFLENNEADLVACAAALDCKPESLVAAREALNR